MRESELQGGGSDAEMVMYVARFQNAVHAGMLPRLCISLVIGSRKRCDDGGVGAGGMFPQKRVWPVRRISVSSEKGFGEWHPNKQIGELIYSRGSCRVGSISGFFATQGTRVWRERKFYRTSWSLLVSCCTAFHLALCIGREGCSDRGRLIRDHSSPTFNPSSFLSYVG